MPSEHALNLRRRATIDLYAAGRAAPVAVRELPTLLTVAGLVGCLDLATGCKPCHDHPALVRGYRVADAVEHVRRVFVGS